MAAAYPNAIDVAFGLERGDWAFRSCLITSLDIFAGAGLTEGADLNVCAVGGVWSISQTITEQWPTSLFLPNVRSLKLTVK